jgi:integrase
MARLVKRTWLSRGPTGHKVRKVAWGYTLQVNGQQQRKVCASWGKEEAKDALDARLLELDAPRAPTTEVTLGEAVDRYVKAKSRKKSIAADERQLVRFKAYFGADTPLGAITAARISAWKAEQLSATCPRTKKPFSAAAINRPLAALRHLLKLAYEEWELLRAVPKIRLEKEPQGRIRWLEADEEARLLEACRASRTKHLAQVVTVALETGLRRAELLGLTWDRVDLSRGVIRIETTKSGRRREVPMRQVVYELLAALPGPREGRLWPARKIRTAFESAVTAAGLADFRFHDCRHHFASWFMMRDGGLPALKEVLGHADLKTTLIYAHLSPAHPRSEIAKTERPAMPSPMPEPFSTKSAQERLAAVESGEGASEVADF